MARVLIHLPERARRGEIIQIRALIGHPMETGYRPGADGRVIARNIIRRFTCTYNGESVFGAELHPAISANPFITFHTLAVDSGQLEFTWEGDNGFKQTERKTLTVSEA
jgi:sulfur-oxidizing protein SoxZ